MSDEFTVRVHDEGSGKMWAEVIELPGCFASGDTFEELQEAVQEAIGLYLDIKITGLRWGPSGAEERIEDHRVLLTA